MEEIKINVKGMTCASCSNTIKRKINRLSFVANTAIDWKDGSTVIQVGEDNDDNRKQISDTISKLGYIVQ